MSTFPCSWIPLACKGRKGAPGPSQPDSIRRQRVPFEGPATACLGRNPAAIGGPIILIELPLLRREEGYIYGAAEHSLRGPGMLRLSRQQASADA